MWGPGEGVDGGTLLYLEEIRMNNYFVLIDWIHFLSFERENHKYIMEHSDLKHLFVVGQFQYGLYSCWSAPTLSTFLSRNLVHSFISSPPRNFRGCTRCTLQFSGVANRFRGGANTFFHYQNQTRLRHSCNHGFDSWISILINIMT